MSGQNNGSRTGGAEGLGFVALFAACLLLLSTPAALGLSSQPAPLPFSTLVYPGYFAYYPITADSSKSIVTFTVSSDAPVSTALMSSSQFSTFNNSQTDLSASLYIKNATTAQASLSEPAGAYWLVFYAYGGTANVSYNFQTYPVDPYYADPLPTPQPTGVASFGLYNSSGNAVSYQIETPEVVGVANITALRAFNATASVDQSNISGATLQLNSVLVVNEAGGYQQSYWVQNTPDFVTSASQLAYGDNVWNFSVSGYLDNNTITSPDGGTTSTFPNGATTGYYYSVEDSNATYSLPMSLVLLMNETVVRGEGVIVGLGAQLLNSTGQVSSPVDWFDKVTIHDPTAQSAYYFVSGNQTAPDGLFYDTELVFGGENNGEATDFTQMNASLGVFYANATSGTLQSFPSLYSFGGDTAEAADNLQVSYTGGGFAHVTTGTPNYVYLGTASGTLGLPLTISNSTTTGSSSSSSSSQGTTTTTQTGQTTTSSMTVHSSSSSPSSSSLSLPVSYVVVILLVASIAGLALGQGGRRRDGAGTRSLFS
ncbi:MAG: thermopsin family protease [Nitrososphaerota archaeon]|nr:thermopsin family protease [Nitrososphaerota archaeon]